MIDAFKPSTSTYRTHTTPQFTVTSGTHVIKIAGTSAAADVALIDAITITTGTPTTVPQHANTDYYLRSSPVPVFNTNSLIRRTTSIYSGTDSRVGSLTVGSRSRTQRVGTRSPYFGDNSMKERQQNTANYPIAVLLVVSTDHITGATSGASPSIYTSKNGGAWTTPTGTLTYDSASAVASAITGWFIWTPTAADRDTLGELRIHVTTPGCDPYDEKYEIVAYDPFLGSNTQIERNAIADTFLTRDWNAIIGTVSARSLVNAARFLRNKWTLTAGGALTVMKEDDVTAAWTGQVTSQSGADPITGNAPTS